MNIKKAIGVCFLAASILAPTTGCVASPFEQNVPSTSWTVDEKGNTVKVQVNASTEKSDPEKVKDSVEALYVAMFDKEILTTYKEVMDEATKGGEKLEADMKASGEPLPGSEERQVANEFITPYVAKLEGFTKHLNTTQDVDSMDIYMATGALLFLQVMILGSEQTNEFKYEVPLSAITVKGDTAIVDGTQVIVYVDGVKAESSGQVSTTATNLDFIKVDGKWVLDTAKYVKKFNDARSANVETNLKPAP